MIPTKAWALLALASFSLAACSSGSGSGSDKRLSPGLSTVEVAPATQIADGAQLATITVTARYSGGSLAGGAEVEVAVTGSNNTVGPQPVITGPDGVATFTLASLTAEVKTITATLRRKGRTVIALSQPTVQFLGDPTAVSAGLSNVSATPATGIVADGVDAALIVVQVNDVNNNPIGGLLIQPAVTGSNQTLTPASAVGNAAGMATFFLTTTRAETKTVSVTVDPGGTAVLLSDTPTTTFIADASTIDDALSSAVAAPASGVVADGTATSTITVVVRDANSNPVPGQAVSLAATGSTNTLTPAVAVTDAAGTATLTLATTAAELKTLTATVNAGPGQVVLTAAPSVGFIGDASTIQAGLSSVTAVPATGVVADDADSSTLTVVVLDINSNPVPGQAVVLSATGTGNTLAPAAATTDAVGSASFSLTSTVAELKTVTATVNPGASQVVLTPQPTVGFIADASTISATLSSVAAAPALGVVADGIQTSVLTITVLDANSNPVPGQAVSMAASGSSNTVAPALATTDASGVASLTLKSTAAELKTVTVTVNPGGSPVVLATLPTVEFVGNRLNLSALLSTASANPATGVVADGAATTTVSVVVIDGNGNTVAGQTVSLTSDGSANTIAPGSALSDAAGAASFTLRSTKAELKTLTLTLNPGPGQIVLVAQPTVAFIGDATTINAVLTGAAAAPASGVVADDVDSSILSIVVRDVNGNPVAGQGVALSSSGTGNTLSPALATSDASGVATLTLRSTVAELKTVTATVNPGAGQVVVSTQPTVQFIADASSISTTLSSVTALPATGVLADGAEPSTVSVILLDAFSNPVPGQGVVIAASGAQNSIAPAFGLTDAGGQADFTLRSTLAELKTVTATANPGPAQVTLVTQPTVEFIADVGSISGSLSTAIAIPAAGVIADGIQASVITVAVVDAFNNPVAGQSVSLTSSGSNNTLAPGSATTDAAGEASFTLATTTAELKSLTATVNPGAGQVVLSSQASVTFIGDPSALSAALSTLVAVPASGVLADDVTPSTITVTVRDTNSNPVAGQSVVLSATGSTNTLSPALVTTDAAGQASLTLVTTTAELKTLTATVNPGASQVVLVAQPTVQFIANAASISASLSAASALPVAGILADGVVASTLTVVVRDAFSNPVPGQSVALASTGTGNTIAPALATTDAAGTATLTLQTTTAETKTVTLTVNPGAGQVVLVTQPSVTFDPLPNINAGLSGATASPTFGLLADGFQIATIAIALKDDGGSPVVGISVQVASSNSGDTLAVGGVTDGAGLTSATIRTTTAELKTLTITANPGPGEVVLNDQPGVEFVWPSSTTYFVRATGSDGNSGTSPAQAFATLSQAALVVAPGDSVFVGAGTYSPATLSVSGTAGSPIRFRADTSGVRTGDAGAVIVDAAGANDGLHIDQADEVWIEGFTILGAISSGGPSGGLRVSASTARLLENRVHGNQNGIYLEGQRPWWDLAYSYRQLIEFGTDHAVLPLGFTASLTLDTRVAGTNIALASGNDLRVVWQPSVGLPVELDRVGDVFDSAATLLEFRLQSELALNASSDLDGAYFLYYGNAGAAAPPGDPSAVYFFAEDFERADSTTIGNGWTEWNAGGDPQLIAGKLSMLSVGNASPPQLGVKQSFPLGAIPGDFRVSFDLDVPPNAENSWVCWGLHIGASASMIDGNRGTGVGPALYTGENLGLSGVEALDNDMSGALENNINGLHSYQLVVNRGAFSYDYYRDGVLRTAGVSWYGAVAVLDQIRMGGDNALLSPGEEWTWDNLELELLVTNDPELTAGPEDTPLAPAGSDVLVEGNVITNNLGASGHGLVADDTTDTIVRNNLIYNNAGSGVLVTGGCVNFLAELNTLYGNTADQVQIDGSGSSAVLRDNLVVLGLAEGLSLLAGSSATSTYNTVWGNLGGDWSGLASGTGDLNLDPRLVDPDGADNLLGGANGLDDSFHLDPAFPSPALDAGSADADARSFASGALWADATTRADGVLDGAAPDGAVANMGYHYPPTTTVLPALAVGDARLFYGEDAQRQPRVRSWTSGTGWTAEGTAPSASRTVSWTVNAHSSLASSEELCAVLSVESPTTELDLLRWDGGAWSVDWTTTAIAEAHAGKQGVDVIFEDASGDALVVYSDNSPTPVFRTRSAGVWSAETSLPLNDAGGPNPDPNSGTVLWIQLAARSGTNELALIYADLDDTLVGAIWDGSQWTAAAVVTLESDLVANWNSGQVGNRPLALAYESLSGDLLVGWGQNGASGVYYSTKAAGSNSWSAASVVLAPVNGQASQVDLVADPTSDRIALQALDLLGTERLGLATWTGAAWQDAGEYDAQIRDVNDLAEGDLLGGVAWVGTSGVAVCIYADNVAGTLDWAVWTIGAGWVVQGPVAIAGKGFTESVLLRGSTGPDRVVAVLSDSTGALYAATFDGGTWALENAGAPLETTLSSSTSVPFSLDVR